MLIGRTSSLSFKSFKFTKFYYDSWFIILSWIPGRTKYPWSTISKSIDQIMVIKFFILNQKENLFSCTVNRGGVGDKKTLVRRTASKPFDLLINGFLFVFVKTTLLDFLFLITKLLSLLQNYYLHCEYRRRQNSILKDLWIKLIDDVPLYLTLTSLT